MHLTQRFKHYGYTLDVPLHLKVHAISFDKKLFHVRTDSQDITLKACHKCKRLLPLESFYRQRSPCRECHMFVVRKWQKSHPELVRIHKKACNKRYKFKLKLRSVGLE